MKNSLPRWARRNYFFPAAFCCTAWPLHFKFAFLTQIICTESTNNLLSIWRFFFLVTQSHAWHFNTCSHAVQCDFTHWHMKILTALHIHTKLGLGIKLIACTDGENVPCTIAEGLRYHQKIGRGSHVVLLKPLTHVVLIKIFDAELQRGDSEQALHDPLQCQPLFRKASVSLRGMRKFWRKRLQGGAAQITQARVHTPA